MNPRNPNVEMESNNLVTTHLKNEKTQFWVEMEKILDDIFSEQIQKHIVVEENWFRKIYLFNCHSTTINTNIIISYFKLRSYLQQSFRVLKGSR